MPAHLSSAAGAAANKELLQCMNECLQHTLRCANNLATRHTQHITSIKQQLCTCVALYTGTVHSKHVCTMTRPSKGGGPHSARTCCAQLCYRTRVLQDSCLRYACKKALHKQHHQQQQHTLHTATCDGQRAIYGSQKLSSMQVGSHTGSCRNCRTTHT
jgi:hypothetical protein